MERAQTRETAYVYVAVKAYAMSCGHGEPCHFFSPTSWVRSAVRDKKPHTPAPRKKASAHKRATSEHELSDEMQRRELTLYSSSFEHTPSTPGHSSCFSMFHVYWIPFSLS